MKHKLIIEFDYDTTENYLKWLEPIHQHCADTNCEFPGFSLKLDIYPTISEIAYGIDKNKLTELGNVNLKLIDCIEG